jgi:3-phosphoshikimate 1-carboxyvinyltransferase
VTARRLPGPVSGLDGSMRVPGSKSLTNRALIAAAAAGGGRITGPLDCDDTRRLAAALDRAGWPVGWGDDITIGPRGPATGARLDLGGSGTGSRLILGLLACTPGSFTVDGSPRLRERPMAPLLEALRELGAVVTDRDGFLPVEIAGRRLAGGRVGLRPEVSSQFVSSLLLAAPLMAGGLDLEVVGPVPSRPYLDLTARVLEAFGGVVTHDGDRRWRVAPGGLRPADYRVEGDWSAAAFPAAAAAVAGGSVTVGPLALDSRQGDRALCDILARAGVGVEAGVGTVRFTGPAVRPFDADLAATPDLFPALIVVAAAAPAGSILTGLDHLKHKESDRLSVMVANLTRIGVIVERGAATVRIVRGLARGPGGEVTVGASDDHRIAMAMAVAGLASGGLVLDDDRCVGKSFPGFWRAWEDLVGGGRRPA